jgi:hypothetical protein
MPIPFLAKLQLFVRRRPFLCLAMATIAIGAAWHALSPEARASSAPVMGVIGAPFIGAMRLSRTLIGSSPLTPLLGTLIGVAPYVLADWLLARARRRQSA